MRTTAVHPTGYYTKSMEDIIPIEVPFDEVLAVYLRKNPREERWTTNLQSRVQNLAPHDLAPNALRLNKEEWEKIKGA